MFTRINLHSFPLRVATSSIMSSIRRSSPRLLLILDGPGCSGDNGSLDGPGSTSLPSDVCTGSIRTWRSASSGMSPRTASVHSSGLHLKKILLQIRSFRFIRKYRCIVISHSNYKEPEGYPVFIILPTWYHLLILGLGAWCRIDSQLKADFQNVSVAISNFTWSFGEHRSTILWPLAAAWKCVCTVALVDSGTLYSHSGRPVSTWPGSIYYTKLPLDAVQLIAIDWSQ